MMAFLTVSRVVWWHGVLVKGLWKLQRVKQFCFTLRPSLMPALFMSHLCAFRLFDVRPAWVAKPTMIQRKYEIFSSRIRADWGGGQMLSCHLSPQWGWHIRPANSKYGRRRSNEAPVHQKWKSLMKTFQFEELNHGIAWPHLGIGWIDRHLVYIQIWELFL